MKLYTGGKQHKKNVVNGLSEKPRYPAKLGIVVLLLSLVGIGVSMGFLTGGMGSLSGTPTLGETTSIITKIIPAQLEKIGNSLFDVIVIIPEKSKVLKGDDSLLISIELINFGEAGKTDTNINYIVTNTVGDIVYIEHEERTVETQISFIKELQIPQLTHGKYKLLVELLYSNTSASATDNFRYSYVN